VSCPSFQSAQWGDDFYETSVSLSNSKVYIHNGYDFGGPGNDATNCGYSSYEQPLQSIAPYTGQARVFRNMTLTVDQSRAIFGMSRSRIKVKVYGTDGKSNYTRWADDIEMYDNSVWGDWGEFIAAHEYGHAFHEKALNGNTGGGCPNPHYLHGRSNETCAFSEGFADFHGAATAAGNNNPYANAFERNAYYGDGGPDTEGPVGAFFLDLADDASARDGIPGDDDNAPYGGYYVSNVIATCTITYREKWEEDQDGIIQEATIRPSTISRLRLCYERTTSPDGVEAVQGTVDSQGQPVIMYAVSVNGGHMGLNPPGYSSAEVARLYHWNLYRQ
jgi:hypothetical protein